MAVKVDGTNGLLQNYDYQVLTTGFSYTFTSANVLAIVPAGTLATGTVTTPASPADGMTITITSTQQITALTLTANTGQTIATNLTSLPAGGSLSYIYRLSNTTWYPYVQAQMQPVVDIQTFNSTATWTKPTGGQTMARIQLWGGGGGASRNTVVGNTNGGGGGGYNEITLQLSSLASSFTATVGGGGAGATTTASGANGGDSSVPISVAFNGVTTISALGGQGGTNGPGGGAGGGQSTNLGTYSVSGGPNTGGAGSNFSAGVGSCWAGGGGAGGVNSATFQAGGASLFGGAGGSANNTTSNSGTAPGGGGGTAYNANVNGGSGAAGRIIITCW